MSQINRFADQLAQSGLDKGSKPQQPEKQQEQQKTEKPSGAKSQEKRSLGLNTIDRNLRRSIARKPVSVAVSSVIDSIANEIFSENAELIELYDNNRLMLLPLDGSKHGTEVSAVLLCREANDMVAVLTLILASTAGDLGERYDAQRSRDSRREGGEPIVIPRVPSDVYAESEEFRNIIFDIVEDSFPGKTVELVGKMVIQNTVDLSNTEAVRGIAYRGIEAVEGYLVDAGKIEDGEFSLTLFDDNVEFIARTTLGNKDKMDELGNPIRSDVEIKVVARQPDQGRRFITQDLVVLNGYMDATWRGQNVDNDNGTNWTIKNTQTFNPVFVITHLDSTSNAVVLPQLVLALMSADLLAVKNRWVAAFSPNQQNPHYTSRFVGDLAVEVPLEGTSRRRGDDNQMMGPILNDSSFDYIDFCNLAFYKDELIIALDIDEAGPLAPLLSVMREAAMGRQQSNRLIATAADELYGGAFVSVWEDYGCPQLVLDLGTRVPMGTLNAHDGKLIDCRNFDNIVACGALDNPEDYAKFDRGLYDMEKDEFRRLSDVLGIYRQSDSSFNLTGYGYRVIINPVFFQILGEVAQDTGITLEYDSNFDGSVSTRRNTRYLEGMGSGGSSIFNKRRGQGERSSGGWGSSSHRYSR